MSYELNNATLLRSFLAHLQSMARRQAALRHEADNHPKSTPKSIAKRHSEPNEIREMWDDLARDLVIVIGPQAALKSYGELAAAGSFSREEQPLGRDPFRITFKALKLLADKARRKHPDLTLLKSWDIVAKEPKTNE